MKQIIFTQPAVEKQLSNFKSNPEINSEIQDFIENDHYEFTVLRIESEAGNGGSHLLQAIANELKRKGERLSYLNFREGDSFADLRPDHIKDLLNSSFLFIDRIHNPLAHESKVQLLDFLKIFAAKKGKLIYSSANPTDVTEKQLIENCFKGEKKVISLTSLPYDQRKLWAIELVGIEEMINIPDKVFLKPTTNKDFLIALEPHKKRVQILKGNDHDFRVYIEKRINILRLEFRKLQVTLAENQFLKDEIIRKQEYEKAADIRDEERNCLNKIGELHERVKGLKEEIPFVPGHLNLLFSQTILINEIEAESKAIDQLNVTINRHIDSLEKEWDQAKEMKETTASRHVVDELRNWQGAIERFNKYKRQ